MNDGKSYSIRDDRRSGFFQIDNEVLDTHAKDVGIYGLAVYIFLVRWSYDRKQCAPGMRKIAETIDISPGSVVNAVKRLEEKGLISIERRLGDDGSPLPHIYVLLPIIKVTPPPCGEHPPISGGGPLPRVVNTPPPCGERNKEEEVREEEKNTNTNTQPSADSSLFPESSEKPVILPPDKKKKRLVPMEEEFVLPDWISAAAWAAFEEMRKKIRKPMTDYARNLAVVKLEKLRRAGNDPNEVINQTVLGSWQSFYEIKQESRNGNQSRLSDLPRGQQRTILNDEASRIAVQREIAAAARKGGDGARPFGKTN